MSREVAERFVNELCGQEVNYVWRGAGSAIFLELGKLTEAKNEHLSGEFTICIEWSWRIENHSSILLGSWSEPDDIEMVTNLLNGLVVSKINFYARLPEIEIIFDNGIYLLSFATAEGNPQWSIKNSSSTYLSVEKGNFVSENNT